MSREAEVAILFADVSGSTRLYEVLGDVRAREIVGQCVATMTDIVTRHGGTLVKTIGDEVMATFPDAESVVTAAAEMQEEITGKVQVEGRAVSIHSGFHFGAVLFEGKDVFGDAVNLASRMANQAKAGQILTTGETVGLLPRLWRASSRQIDRTEVKGRREPVDVYEVVWKSEDVTLLGQRPWENAPHRAPGLMVLSVGDHQVVIGDAQPMLTLGRATENDVVVKGSLVSRLHARIEYRNGRFTLTDLSVNGTYVTPIGGEPQCLRRDSQVLRGRGLLGLGGPPEAGAVDAIRYAVAD